MQEAEEWRPINDAHGYEVSSLGRVRGPSGPLRLPPNIKGYLTFSAAGKTRRVHREVLTAFIGPCPPDHQGSHLDGDPANNRPSNLAWMTCRENILMKREHGTMAIGERHGLSRLTAEKVTAIRRDYPTVQPGRDAWVARRAAELGVSTATIREIIRRETWRHVA